ncbi:17020_t:CDS:2 [Dentiscutata erythropus]|uniref:17020_t:CDS:1 n=1 Tax=Dentiscutata erythropus TaxID=1348616 RepID=A0A9N9CHN8_9GLOM|nr:17020_t:CDS:2 [Dentiscutata erythropus]
MLDTQDNDSVKSEIIVKFLENHFVPSNDEKEVPRKKSKLQESIKQVVSSSVKESRREVIKKTLSYNLPKGLTEYLCLYEDVRFTQKKTPNKGLERTNSPMLITLKKYPIDEITKCYWATAKDEELVDYYYEDNYTWINKKSTSNFTWNTFNLIDDTPIELWESDSISENLLLDFTDENEGNTILFPTDLNNFSWWLKLLERPSEHYYREFNNFSDTYLCNSIWWKTANPIRYL